MEAMSSDGTPWQARTVPIAEGLRHHDYQSAVHPVRVDVGWESDFDK